MKFQVLFSGVVALLLAGACTSTQPVASSEYDDVYFTSSDYEERSSPARQRDYADREDYQESRYYEDGYRDMYDEDDFYFSRRIRRFNQPNFNAWRYYDPFFTNDLYYVMGTPYWDRWNSLGWYNWNRPRFGAGLTMGFGNPLFGPRFGAFDPFWGVNSFNYYNPWVSSYYGFDPYFGYGFGARSAFFDPYFGSSYLYCPPAAYVSSAAYRTVNVSRRASLSSLRSQTGYQPGISTTRTQSVGASTAARRPTSSPRTSSTSNYFQPKTAAEKSATLSQMDRRRNAIRRENATYNTNRVSPRTNSNVNTRATGTNTRTYPSRSTNINTNRRSSTINRNPSVNRRSTMPTTRRSTTPTRRSTPTSRPPSYNRSSQSSPSFNRSSSPAVRSSPSRSSSSAPSSRSSSSRRPPR